MGHTAADEQEDFRKVQPIELDNKAVLYVGTILLGTLCVPLVFTRAPAESIMTLNP